jgi:hypothetical protein
MKGDPILAPPLVDVLNGTGYGASEGDRFKKSAMPVVTPAKGLLTKAMSITKNRICELNAAV